MPVTPALGGGDRGLLGVCRPAALAELVRFGVRERDPVSKSRWRVGEEDIPGRPLASLCTHT